MVECENFFVIINDKFDNDLEKYNGVFERDIFKIYFNRYYGV